MTLTSADRALGAAVVAAGVLFQSFWLGRAATPLSVALVATYFLWLAGAWSLENYSILQTYVFGLVVFLLHATEEFLGDFPRRFPALVGDQWSDTQFLVFNGVWFTVFAAAAWALGHRKPIAVLVVLFFAAAGGVGNGVVHLLLALRQQGYFPGVVTAPLCLMVGALLLRQLFHRAKVEGVHG